MKFTLSVLAAMLALPAWAQDERRGPQEPALRVRA